MLTKINFVSESTIDGAEPFAFVTRVPSGETLYLKGEPVNVKDLHTLDQNKPSLDREGFELVELAYDVDMVGLGGWQDDYVEQMVQYAVCLSA